MDGPFDRRCLIAGNRPENDGNGGFGKVAPLEGTQRYRATCGFVGVQDGSAILAAAGFPKTRVGRQFWAPAKHFP